jgi:hypothetical protein
MRRAWAIAHLSFWILLLVAFCCVSSPPIFQRSLAGSIRLINDTPFHSTDALLKFATQRPDLSDRLVTFFNAAPAKSRIVVLQRNDDVLGSLIGMLTAYLSWPHPVKMLELTNKEAESADATLINDAIPTSAIVFSRLDPSPNFPPSYRLGEGLALIPLPVEQ